MLVQEDLDAPHIIRVGRGAPARWIAARTPFGISEAPTRQGRVSFSLHGTTQGMAGHVSISANPGQQPHPSIKARQRLFSVKLGKPGVNISVHARGAAVLHIDHAEGLALFGCESDVAGFNFTSEYVG